jgi:negative regulator of sigma E activity
MTQVPDEFVEQLSAYMDGELPEAEARFLRRRLEHDAELRAAWTRLQLASQCLRGQPWRVVDDAFPERVAQGLAASSPGVRGPWLRWAMAASVAALALLMAPRLIQQQAAPEPTIAEVPAPVADHLVPTPGAAVLVALRAPAAAPAPAPRVDEADDPPEEGTLLAAATPSDRASPRPLDNPTVESPTEFPLVENAEARRWPRSELVGASSDPAIEAYLVRHNQMVASDGLGGFVPYVDVVANGQPASADAEAAAQAGSAEGEGGQ